MPSKAWLQSMFTVGGTEEEGTELVRSMAEPCSPPQKTERKAASPTFHLWLKPSLTPDLLQVCSAPWDPGP